MPDESPTRIGMGTTLTSQTLIAAWEQFLNDYYKAQIEEAALAYPEVKSIFIDWIEIDKRDPTLAEYLLQHPRASLEAASQAVRSIEVPVEPRPRLYVRVRGLPKVNHFLVRKLRAEHLGQFVAIEGMVKKAVEVRPKMMDAVFRCELCGTVFKIVQEDQILREPDVCPEEQGGCGRKAVFKLLTDESKYIDSQKIEIQESHEDLRGGAQPERIAVYIEDDLVGSVAPGDRVVINGILRAQQRRQGSLKYVEFLKVIDCISIELRQQEFEEVEILPEDLGEIQKIASNPDPYKLIRDSFAPEIYGLEEIKDSLIMALFGGQSKEYKDGTRLRGDIHVLLVGDPGCLIGDERITMGNGTVTKLESMGRRHLERINAQVRLATGGYRNGRANRFHAYHDQPIMEVVTETGKCIKGTYNHPLLVWDPERIKSVWRRLDQLKPGDRLRVAPSIKCWKRALVPTAWKEPSYYHKSWRIKVPEVVDEDLAALMGYLVGDGWVGPRKTGYVVALSEMDLAPRLAQMFDDVFGVRPKRLPARGGVATFEVNRTPICEMLKPVQLKRVPDVIFQSRNSVVRSFLQWLYEADGSCFAKGRGATSISLRSANLELLRDVQVLLLRWGIHSSISWGKAPRPHLKDGRFVKGGESGTLMVRRAGAILRFAQYVGFASRRKNARLRKVAAYARRLPRRRHRQLSERIVSVRPAGRANVYDIEVPKHHRFIANGIISHNTAKSQILRYLSKLAPRAIYTSGKGSSASGLTAAAVRDEFGEGQWSLEAGALVLADKGMAMIDELDKMDANDQSAMHQAMEQQEISIAKAGITATLKSRCAVIGAANPKLGRFDEFTSIIAQINMPPPLLSRFDLIFSLRDKPKREVDAALARHILTTHRAGEVQEYRREDPEGAYTEEDEKSLLRHIAPAIEAKMLRKYIAYAKRSISPVMTSDAMEAIQQYYVDLRSSSTTIPFTARALESMVRLTEASARARLSKVATAEDAQRSIQIYTHALRGVGWNEETGSLDIDIIAAGASQSQQDRMRRILQIIREHSNEQERRFPDSATIVREAVAQGIPEAKVREALQILKERGSIFTPGHDRYGIV